jgi:2-polyprenyl-3-methyl-5-hydroxy-6-metoxy-1,4-benzoquinol methylase
MSTPWFDTRKNCPACNCDSFKTIYQTAYDRDPIKGYLIDFYSPQGGVEFEYLKDAEYILCECDNCRMIFQKDIPNNKLMKRLYEHWIDPDKVLNQHPLEDDLAYYSAHAQEIMQLIAHFKQHPSSLSFLDFGMGWGQWALMAKAFGCNSYGIELSKQRIEHAQLNGIKVLSWEKLPEHRFDFINTEQVFEHIPDPIPTLRYLTRSLKDPGIIKISVPPAKDIKRRLKLMDWKLPKANKLSLNPVAPLEHINFFRRTSIIKMAEQAQLIPTNISIITQYRHTTDWSTLKGSAKNILLPIFRNVLQKGNYIFLKKQ